MAATTYVARPIFFLVFADRDDDGVLTQDECIAAGLRWQRDHATVEEIVDELRGEFTAAGHRHVVVQAAEMPTERVRNASTMPVLAYADSDALGPVLRAAA